MSPWIPIAISIASSIIFGLLGFIVKRELGRQAEANNQLREALSHEVTARETGQDQIIAEIKELAKTLEARYMSRELFDRLEASRKEVDQLRREQDTRLEGLIRDLLAKYGG